MAVDDRPVLALATTVPLWRDLAPGATGPDVRSLQDELARLGHPIVPDGAFGQHTATAVRNLMAAAGAIRPTGVLPVASVLWLPAPTVDVGTCDAVLGGVVAPGDSVATGKGTLVALSVSGAPAEATAGARVLRYGTLSAPIDETGRVSAPEFLAAVQSGPELATALASEPSGTMTLDYVLASPIEVAVVPPGALQALDGTAGCLTAADGAHPVTVISSSLGQTFVTLDDESRPGAVDVAAQDTAPTCR